jgi:hypothetical protein
VTSTTLIPPAVARLSVSVRRYDENPAGPAPPAGWQALDLIGVAGRFEGGVGEDVGERQDLGSRVGSS